MHTPKDKPDRFDRMNNRFIGSIGIVAALLIADTMRMGCSAAAMKVIERTTTDRNLSEVPVSSVNKTDSPD